MYALARPLRNRMLSLSPGIFALILLSVPAIGADEKPKPAPRATTPRTQTAPRQAPAPQAQPARRQTPPPQRQQQSTPPANGNRAPYATPQQSRGAAPNSGAAPAGRTYGRNGSTAITGGGAPAGSGISGRANNSPAASTTLGGHGRGISGTVNDNRIGGSRPEASRLPGNSRPNVAQPPVYQPRAGMQQSAGPSGSHVYTDPRTGASVHTRQDGRVTEVRQRNLTATSFRPGGYAGHVENMRPDGSRMLVDRGYRGERRVEVVHPNGVRVVSVGRVGFVERPVRPGFVSRTYIVGGRTQVFVYRTHFYGGVAYYTYVPRVYYQPAFYAWAYNPWARPVVYTWGWGPAPWFYGGYFAPEPVYVSPSLWLTDYILAENLRAAYDSQMAAGAPVSEPEPMATATPLTPEVKQLIASEVQRELQAEQQAASQPDGSQPSGRGGITGTVPSEVPAALDPAWKLFVVSTVLNVDSLGEGQSCALTQGDIIERTSRIPDAQGKIAVTVLNSKEGDCPVDVTTNLDVATLQEMHNQFRAKVGSGLEQLANDQGKNGIPTGAAANPRLVVEAEAPAAEDAKELVAKQIQEADQTEADVRQAAGGQR